MSRRYIYLFLLIIVAKSFADVLHVPSVDYATIQSAIDAALTSDTVLVQPGEYVENLNFNGKSITVGSLTLTTGDTSFMETTIINGDNDFSNQGCVVMFVNGEDSFSRLIGFTITGGYY